MKNESCFDKMMYLCSRLIYQKYKRLIYQKYKQ